MLRVSSKQAEVMSSRAADRRQNLDNLDDILQLLQNDAIRNPESYAYLGLG